MSDLHGTFRCHQHPASELVKVEFISLHYSVDEMRCELLARVYLCILCLLTISYVFGRQCSKVLLLRDSTVCKFLEGLFSATIYPN
eukprot:jgi/Psemu1/307978/fgenesh1_kg.368_\